MSARQRLIAVIAGIALIGVYSWVMTAADGTASWAWILLVVAIVCLAAAARSVATARGDHRER
jgi:transketolase C-terminal domain/subunit